MQAPQWFPGAVRCVHARGLVAALAVTLVVANGCRKSTPAQVPLGRASGPSAGDSRSDVPEEKTVRQVPGPKQVAGRDVYLRHCAACHGDNGDGKGIAAAYLYPKPRNFRLGKFRLVRMANLVPTVQDIHDVLARGMPGSTMPPWPHLTEGERRDVSLEVVRLYRDGLRDQYVKSVVDAEGITAAEVDAEETQEFVTRRTTPAEPAEVPALGEAAPESIAQGKLLYFKQGCQACHGNEGKGDGVQKMIDDEGLPMRPRDLTRGIYKGGHDPASLYRRLALGMPGTPMPGSPLLKPEQIVDLVHFLRSLSDEETRQAAVLKRERLVAKAVPTKLTLEGPEAIGDAAWNGVEPVRLRMVPLWWRNDADPGLEVQALHDGQSLAIRLSWHDATPDRHASQTQAFKDAIAVELYRGAAEPFLGMGGPKAPVDLWFWDADRQEPTFAVENQYPRTVVDVYPFSEQAVATAEYDRPGTKLSAQPPLSLPALAAGNQIVPGKSPTAATNLTAGGPGSATFRISQNQMVRAFGEWREKRWTVVMLRSLAASSPGEGVPLERGQRVSMAFAVWDGGHKDRDGQKLISIWQDLVVE